MNRREFTRAALAGALSPALPLRALAAGAGTAAAPINPITYAWSAHYASLSPNLTAEALARRFAMAPDAAGAIFQRLQSAGIIGAPNAMGVAKVSTAHARPPVVAKPSQAARKLAERLVSPQDDVEEAQDDSEDFTNG